MDLPELTGRNVTEKSLQLAYMIRDQLLPVVTGFLDGSHVPKLSPGERNRVIDKILRLIATESRIEFWWTLERQLTPGVYDGVAHLTPVILQWAGRTTTTVRYKELKKKKPPAPPGGRVIRKSGGL